MGDLHIDNFTIPAPGSQAPAWEPTTQIQVGSQRDFGNQSKMESGSLACPPKLLLLERRRACPRDLWRVISSWFFVVCTLYEKRQLSYVICQWRYWETIITIILSILSVVQTITGILITILYSPLIAHSILYFVLCTLKKRVSLVIGHLFTRRPARRSETKAGAPSFGAQAGLPAIVKRRRESRRDAGGCFCFYF